MQNLVLTNLLTAQFIVQAGTDRRIEFQEYVIIKHKLSLRKDFGKFTGGGKIGTKFFGQNIKK